MPMMRPSSLTASSMSWDEEAMRSSNHSLGISPRSRPLRESWISSSRIRVASVSLYSVKVFIII